MTLTFTQSHKLRLKVDNCLTCSLMVIFLTTFNLWHFKLGMTVDVLMTYNYVHAHVDDHDLDTR